MRLDALAAGRPHRRDQQRHVPAATSSPTPRGSSATCEAFFPPQQGTFLIGPMAKLGWGTPTLVSLSLGRHHRDPRQHRASSACCGWRCPTDEIAVVVLQVSFIGAHRVRQVARLVLRQPLTTAASCSSRIDGEMGLLIAFGDDANFVLAVGGFHPRFSPPPLPFPTPRRICDRHPQHLGRRGSAPRATSRSPPTRCSSAASPRRSSASARSTSRATSSFDALIRFSPFYFIVDFSSHFAVKVFGVGVWGLRIRLEVEGPTPWHAQGSAGISLLFFDIDVDIDITWGERRDTTLPPIAGAAEAGRGALEGARAGGRCRPPGASLLVSLRKLPDGAERSCCTRSGTLQVSQRFVPLDAKLDRVGAQRPSDGTAVHRSAVASTVSEARRRRRAVRAGPVRGPVRRRPAVAQGLRAAARRASSCPAAGAQLESGAADRPGRPLRAHHRRHQRAGAPPASVLPVRARLLYSHWLTGAAASRSAAQRHDASSAGAGGRGVKTRRGGASRSPWPHNNVAASAASATSPARARPRVARRRGRRRPDAGRPAPRRPAVRAAGA